MNNSKGTTILTLCQNAREAAQDLALAVSSQKTTCLQAVASELQDHIDEIRVVNEKDVQAARQSGLSPALLDRMTLTPKRITEMVNSLLEVARLDDPIGGITDTTILPNGLQLSKMRVPIGVIAVIYESRPNVTIEVASLTIKTGNALILRGGSETTATNRTLVAIIQNSLQTVGLPSTSVQYIDNPDRNCINQLLGMYDYIDLLIPRGGNALQQFCRKNSTIPVITGGIGICHLFVDETADIEASLKVIQNAKVQRPTVCNALDTVLVHKNIAKEFLPKLIRVLQPDGVTFRVAENALPFLCEFTPPLVISAGLEDFDTEWLSLVLGIKIVNSLDEAIQHIQLHSTRHSDGILTNDSTNAARFIARVNSAAVYVNTSTRFTDGGQFGLGGEVAVSTQPIHARGPMGLEALTSYKWVGKGNYLIRK
jgi:glutamate-5-semialdehyde dehydrogenase